MRQLLNTDELKLVCGGRDGNGDGGNSRSSFSASSCASAVSQGASSAAKSVQGIGGPYQGAITAAASVVGGVHAAVTSSSCSSRVICTHFYRKGMLDQSVWRADMAFTFKNLSPTTVRGYHVWAIPYVRLMRKSPLAEKLMFPIAKYRAQELAYQMGVVEKGSQRSKQPPLECCLAQSQVILAEGL